MTHNMTRSTSHKRKLEKKSPSSSEGEAVDGASAAARRWGQTKQTGRWDGLRGRWGGGGGGRGGEGSETMDWSSPGSCKRVEGWVRMVNQKVEISVSIEFPSPRNAHYDQASHVDGQQHPALKGARIHAHGGASKGSKAHERRDD